MAQSTGKRAVPIIERLSIDYLNVRSIDGPPVLPILGTVLVSGTIHAGDGTLIPIEGEMSGVERAELDALLERVGKRLLDSTRRSLGEDEG